MFIHTLSDFVGEIIIVLLYTCLRNNVTFNEFVFCDLQNVEISKNINDVFMHYLY